jgi:hypothetical protein
MTFMATEVKPESNSASGGLKQALRNSEDSVKLNTSFVDG